MRLLTLEKSMRLRVPRTCREMGCQAVGRFAKSWMLGEIAVYCDRAVMG